LGELAESPEGGAAHGAGGLAEDRAGGPGVQAEDHPQHHGPGLLAGERRDQRDGRVGGDVVESPLGGVLRGDPVGELLG